jgi:hypothetical protein
MIGMGQQSRRSPPKVQPATAGKSGPPAPGSPIDPTARRPCGKAAARSGFRPGPGARRDHFACLAQIFIDDLGYGDIGPFGATKQKTPNLDRMAQEGMKLTSFYAAPVCSVSRAQLMTGCYGARVSVPGVFGPGPKTG